MTLTKGFYSTPKGKMVILKNVKIYEDLKKSFAIVTWVDENGTFPKTLITPKTAKLLKRIGNL